MLILRIKSAYGNFLNRPKNLITAINSIYSYMIIIIELTRLQVDLKAKIKYSIEAINSIHLNAALFVITFLVLTPICS